MTTRNKILRSIAVSTVLLVLPYVGSLVLDGWNWTILDYAFAWVLFTFLSISITFITTGTYTATQKTAGALAVIAVFLAVWIQAAVGIV